MPDEGPRSQLQTLQHQSGVCKEGNFSRFAQEGGLFFRDCFAHLSKVVFILAILCAPEGGV